MKGIVVTRPFAFAHGGHTVEHFEPGDAPREVPDECADVAVREGWARHAKARPAAPENKGVAVAAASEDPTGRPAVKRTRPTKPAAASDAGDPTPKD